MKDRAQFEFKPFESTIKKPKHYIRLTDNMMQSPAWKELKSNAMVLYINIKAKYNFTNSNNLEYTYKEGIKLMDKKTFTKSLDQLIEHGFIHIVRQGVLKECSIYGLSNEWQYYGTIAFNVKPRTKRVNKTKGEK